MSKRSRCSCVECLRDYCHTKTGESELDAYMSDLMRAKNFNLLTGHARTCLCADCRNLRGEKDVLGV